VRQLRLLSLPRCGASAASLCFLATARLASLPGRGHPRDGRAPKSPPAADGKALTARGRPSSDRRKGHKAGPPLERSQVAQVRPASLCGIHPAQRAQLAASVWQERRPSHLAGRCPRILRPRGGWCCVDAHHKADNYMPAGAVSMPIRKRTTTCRLVRCRCPSQSGQLHACIDSGASGARRKRGMPAAKRNRLPPLIFQRVLLGNDLIQGARAASRTPHTRRGSTNTIVPLRLQRQHPHATRHVSTLQR
jgi:hypothetical protein